MTSAEYIAVTRAMSIVKFAISDQLRYLEAYAHELSCYGWIARHMSKQYDILESVLEAILENTSLFINKDYMMDIFSETKAMLPPFRDYIKFKYEEKQHRCVRDGSSAPKMCLHEHIINELFYPTNETNADT